MSVGERRASSARLVQTDAAQRDDDFGDGCGDGGDDGGSGGDGGSVGSGGGTQLVSSINLRVFFAGARARRTAVF